MEDISYISGHNGLITEEILITLIPEGDTKGGVVRTKKKNTKQIRTKTQDKKKFKRQRIYWLDCFLYETFAVVYIPTCDLNMPK